MKFSEIRRFAGKSLEEAIRYLTGELGQGVRDLFVGLGNLSFTENFQSFVWEGTIEAGAEQTLANNLPTIPTYWVVANAVGGNQIVRGATTWTVNRLSLKNAGGASATVKVLFFK